MAQRNLEQHAGAGQQGDADKRLVVMKRARLEQNEKSKAGNRREEFGDHRTDQRAPGRRAAVRPGDKAPTDGRITSNSRDKALPRNERDTSMNSGGTERAPSETLTTIEKKRREHHRREPRMPT